MSVDNCPKCGWVRVYAETDYLTRRSTFWGSCRSECPKGEHLHHRLWCDECGWQTFSSSATEDSE